MGTHSIANRLEARHGTAVRRFDEFAYLGCALPVNNIDLSGRTNDNDITSFRIHYQDGDGAGTSLGMTVDLLRTLSTPTGYRASSSRTGTLMPTAAA